MTEWRRLSLARLDIATAIVLGIILSSACALPWLKIDPQISAVFYRWLLIEGVVAIVLAHLLFVHVELMAAALVPAAIMFLVLIGVVSSARMTIGPANWQFILLLAALCVWYSVSILQQGLREFRCQPKRSPRVEIAVVATTALVGYFLLPRIEPWWIVIVGPLALWLSILPAIVVGGRMQALLLGFGGQLPWTMAGHRRSTNELRRVRALYSYLKIYDEQYVYWKLRIDPIFRSVYALVPPNAEVLDAGCGVGIMSNGLAMQSASRRVVGVDLDERKLRAARCAARTIPNVQYVSADLLTYDFPPSDCVLMIDVLHYWTPEKQGRLIAKAATSLRPGGMIVFREGLNSKTLAHRLVHWAERWAVFWKQNPQGDGLCFQDRDFYVGEFEKNGLKLREEVRELGLGSNTVLLFDKPISDQNG